VAIQVIKYSPKYYDSWNEFVLNAVNGTFLFHRDFMEYHKDRFEDYSLLVLSNEKIVAVFPANIRDNTVFSHQGLTYGGLIVHEFLAENFFLYLNSIKVKLKKDNHKSLVIKQMPAPYNQEIATHVDEEANYKAVKQEANMQVNLNSFTISKSKLKHYRKGQKHDFTIVENDDLAPFWHQILVPLLTEKYDAAPVHSLEEINFLKAHFPHNILQYSLFYQGEIIAGITLFIANNRIVKSQYGATSPLGKKLRAMDFLFIELLNKYKQLGFAYFDMGTATDDSFEGGINLGLMNQKKELGCEVFAQNTYEFFL